MGRLARYLPPFAADYSGAAATLNGLGGLIVMLDPGCCTYNYTRHDETRWSTDSTGIVSGQLRMVDTILGADDTIIDQMEQLITDGDPPFAALIATPVPALIGMDVVGMADELAARVDIPILPIETTGTAWYPAGMARALEALISAFVGSTRKPAPDAPLTVNLLGLSPFDHGSPERATTIVSAFGTAAIRVNAALPLTMTLDSVRDLTAAHLNIVMSSAALPSARTLEREHGIPYVVGHPFDPPGEKYRELLRAVVEGEADPFSCVRSHDAGGEGEGDILIVGEQVGAHSLARTLRDAGVRSRMDIASFFHDRKSAKELGTIRLEGERDLMALLGERERTVLIADPLVLRMPAAERALNHLAWPQRALSSDLFDEVEFPLMEAQVQEVIDEVQDALAR